MTLKQHYFRWLGLIGILLSALEICLWSISGAIFLYGNVSPKHQDLPARMGLGFLIAAFVVVFFVSFLTYIFAWEDRSSIGKRWDGTRA